MGILKRLEPGVPCRWSTLAAICVLAGAPAFAQGIAQTPPGGEKPRAKKVWTEDDLVALRTPYDRYVIEQQRKAAEEQAAREAEQAAKKAAEAERKKHGLPAGALPPPAPLPLVPERREDIQKRVDQLRKSVADLESRVRTTQDEDYSTREDQHAELAVRLAALQEQLDKDRKELQNLEEKLRGFSAPPG